MRNTTFTYFLKLILFGFGVSLMGTLPFGVLNVTAMQIASVESFDQAFIFSWGVIIIELIYLILSLWGLHYFRSRSTFFYWGKWLLVLLLLGLALVSFNQASQTIVYQYPVLLHNDLNRFVLGMLLSSVNPAQIPFWMGWNLVLLSRGTLLRNKKSYLTYIISVGLGTFSGLLIFIYLGLSQANFLQDHKQIVDYAISIVFLLTAVWQSIPLFKGVKK